MYTGGLLGTILKTIPTELIITSTGNILNEIPDGFKLSQNYPNPFNPVTNISFSLPADANVKILIYDVSGKMISELLNKKMPGGKHTVNFNGNELSTGTYFYRLSANSSAGIFTETKKMILIK